MVSVCSEPEVLIEVESLSQRLSLLGSDSSHSCIFPILVEVLRGKEGRVSSPSRNYIVVILGCKLPICGNAVFEPKTNNFEVGNAKLTPCFSPESELVFSRLEGHLLLERSNFPIFRSKLSNHLPVP